MESRWFIGRVFIIFLWVDYISYGKHFFDLLLEWTALSISKHLAMGAKYTLYPTECCFRITSIHCIVSYFMAFFRSLMRNSIVEIIVEN